MSIIGVLHITSFLDNHYRILYGILVTILPIVIVEVGVLFMDFRQPDGILQVIVRYIVTDVLYRILSGDVIVTLNMGLKYRLRQKNVILALKTYKLMRIISFFIVHVNATL